MTFSRVRCSPILARWPSAPARRRAQGTVRSPPDRTPANTRNRRHGICASTPGRGPLASPPGLRQTVPSAAADSVLQEMAALNEHPQVLLQRVAAGSGQCDRIAYGDAAMVAGVIDDPQGKIGHGREQELLALDLVGQT